MHKIPLFKRFDIKITDAEKTYAQEFELDKNAECVCGILISSDREDLMYQRGEQKVEINGKEYFPEDYETKHLMSSVNVAPNSRYYKTGRIKVINGKIKISYSDKAHALAAFVPYRFTLNVEYEPKEEA